MPQLSFYTPRKHQKTVGFLIFPGGIERPVTFIGAPGALSEGGLEIFGKKH